MILSLTTEKFYWVWQEIISFAFFNFRRKTPPSWGRWGNTAPGQHGHSAQTPEEKTFWTSLSDSVSAVSASASVSVKAESVLV